MRHFAFLEALVMAPDDGPHWRAVMGGLLVLRLVDAWRDDPGGELRPDAIELAGARDAVERIPNTAMRRVLDGLIDTLERTSPVPNRVAEGMLAYARELAARGSGMLADDVLVTALSWKERISDRELRFDLMLALQSVRASALAEPTFRRGRTRTAERRQRPTLRRPR